jgi:hypothetical protein
VNFSLADGPTHHTLHPTANPIGAVLCSGTSAPRCLQGGETEGPLAVPRPCTQLAASVQPSGAVWSRQGLCQQQRAAGNYTVWHPGIYHARLAILWGVPLPHPVFAEQDTQGSPRCLCPSAAPSAAAAAKGSCPATHCPATPQHYIHRTGGDNPHIA